MAEIVYRLLKVIAGISLIFLSVLMIILLIRQKMEWTGFYFIKAFVIGALSLLFTAFAFMLFRQVTHKSLTKTKGILDEGEINKDEEIDGSTI